MIYSFPRFRLPLPKAFLSEKKAAPPASSLPEGCLVQPFVEQKKEVAVTLFIKNRLLGKCSGISFIDGMQLMSKFKSDTKGAFMKVANKVIQRKRAIIEAVNNEQKNLARGGTLKVQVVKIKAHEVELSRCKW